MVVQSGALFPDTEMVQALERYYTVAAFTGVPVQGAKPGDPQGRALQPPATPLPQASYSRIFRLAAARGGYEAILVYWGVLESQTQGLGTKAISWVPIVGSIVPDQSQQMRIRLTMALIDVRTGQWETFMPEPFLDDAVSNQLSRASSDQEQVGLLKTKAYKAASEALVGRFGR